MLEAQGIDCIVKNDRLASLAGEIPMVTVWPELWVTDSLKADWAEEIIAEANEPAKDENKWVCKNCGEEHSDRFTDCWNCQNVKAF